MKTKLKAFFAIIVLSILSSCQRVIDVNVSTSSPLIVIEGNLTDAYGTQTVTISNTVPYSNANVYPPVKGASVSFTDELGYVHALRETQPGTYTLNNFQGNPLQIYTLTVKSGSQTYTATSMMPAPVNLDSLSLTGETLGNKIVKTVGVTYHDQQGVMNQYRFIMYVNNVQVPRIFVANDTYNDGRMVTTLLYEDDIELQSGDKVDIDMECIDANVYNYWFSLSSQGGNTPQDSSTPGNPPSNFNNGALGYFSAHTIQRKSFVVL